MTGGPPETGARQRWRQRESLHVPGPRVPGQHVSGQRDAVRIVGQLRRDRAGLLRTTALQAAVLSLLSAMPTGLRAQPAPNAHPAGGQVVAGSAKISQGGALTSIDQSSQHAAINWQSFDIGSQQTVQFNQPNASAVVLNRVNSSDPSQIAGQLHANGQVIITNPAGVIFGNGAQVDTAGLVVSTAGISTQNFMAGRMVFDQPGSADARIQNDGTISIKDAGLAALVAPQVANRGVITAKMGHVVLGGAVAHTVDLYGDGLLSIDVTGEVTQAPIGPDGKPVTALVTNTGIIRADGGTVRLTARAVDGIVRNLVTAGGTISADTVGSHVGTVSVVGIGGDATVTGLLAARGLEAGAAGGAAEVNATGAAIVASGASLDVSGRAGGGVAALGTTLARARGGAPVMPTPTSKSATLASGGSILADATDSGAGGSVVMLSQNTTSIGGVISARGGQSGGQGGFVEISSEGIVALDGSVDVRARDGVSASGSILLDPADVAITNSGSNGTVVIGGTTYSVITSSQLLGSLLGNAEISATDTLLVSLPTGSTSFTGATLTSLILSAGSEVDVESNLSFAGGQGTQIPLTLSGGNRVYVGVGDTVTTTGGITVENGLTPGTGGIEIDGALIAGANSPVSLSFGSGGATVPGLISANSVNFNSTSGALLETGVVSGNTVTGTIQTTFLSGSAASVTLSGGANSITTLGAINALGTSVGTLGDINLVTASDLSINAILSGRNISLEASTASAGALVFGESGGADASGLLSMLASEGVDERLGFITATQLNAQAGILGGIGSLLLTGSNTIPTLTGLSAPLGNITLADSSFTSILPITAGTAGNTATGTISLQASGNMTLSAAVTASSTVSLSGSGGTFGAAIVAPDTLALRFSNNVTQTAGIITAGTLSGTIGNSDRFQPNAFLTDGNAIASLGNFNVQNGTFALGDNQTLAVTGVTRAGDVSLRVQGFTATSTGSLAASDTLEITPFSPEPMVIGATAGAGTLAIADATGLPIGQGEGSANTLRLGAYTDNPSAPTIYTPTAESITVSGLFTDTSTALELHTTNTLASTGNLAISALLDATGEPVTLFLAGTATETTAGSITADTLSGTLAAGIFDNGGGAGTGNNVASLGTINAAGLFRFDDSGAIALGGTINAQDVSLRGTSFSPGSFSITGSKLIELAPLTSGPVSLGGSAAFNIPTATTLDTPLLRVGEVTSTSSTLAANPAQATANAINIPASGFSFPSRTRGLELDSAGTIGVAGALISGSGTLARFVAGATGSAIQLSNSVSLGGGTGTTIELDTSRGNAVQTANSVLTAQTLTGALNGTLSLPNQNQLNTITNVSAVTSLGVTDAVAVTVVGSLSVPGGALALDDHAGIAFGSTTPASVTGATVTLDATGAAITETAASGISATELRGGGTAASVSLTGTGNAITTLGSFTSSGDFALADSTGLTAVGTAASTGGSIGLSLNGNLVFGQIGTLGQLSARSVVIADPTGTASAIDGGISATTLSGTLGAIELSASATNTITTLTALTTTNDLLLSDTRAITLTGTVTTGAGSTLGLTDPTGIAIGGFLVSELRLPRPATVNTGTLSLAAAGGPVTESAGSSINATSLNGGGQTASVVSLIGVNTIANLGGFASSGGFTLDDASGLTVDGAASAGTTLAIATGGSLAIGVASGSAGSLAGGLVALTTTGAITEPNGGISATTLQATADAITLPGATNSIDTLASSTGTNGFLLLDATPLTIAGTIAAPSSGNVGIVDDSIRFATGAALAANTTNGAIELAPVSSTGTFTLASIAGTIGALSGAILRLGAYTANGTKTITAGTVVNDASFTLPSSFRTLEADSLGAIDINAGIALSGTGAIVLDADGAIVLGAGLTAPGGSVLLSAGTSITQTAGVINAASLTATATAASSSVSLTRSNLVATLTSSGASAGFAFQDAETLTLPGTISGGTGTASIATSAGTLIQPLAGSITGAGISLTGPSLALAGGITTSGLATIDATSISGTIDQTGTLSAGTLGFTASQFLFDPNDANFAGASATANTITSLAASTSNGLILRDSGDLTITGAINTGAINTGASPVTISTNGSLGVGGAGSLDGAALSLTGTSLAIAAGGSIAGTAVTLDATTAGIAINGGLTGTTSLALNASGASGSVTGTGAVSTSLLTGTATGGFSLNGVANTIADLGTLTAATLSLNDASPLDVTGAASATSATLAAPGLTVDGSVIGATISLAGTTTGITLNGLVSGSTAVTLDAPAGTIAGAGTLQANSLTGTASGNVSLTDVANAIGTLGNFGAGTLALVSGTLGQPFAVNALTVAGTVTAGPLGITASDPIIIASGGSIAATTGTLTASSLTISGSATGSTSLGLTATAAGAAGTIAETGSLASGSLHVSAPGSVTLNGASPNANLLTSLGNVSADGISLRAGTSATLAGLTIDGVINGTGLVAIAETGTLSTAASAVVTATAVNLGAATLNLDGLIEATTVSLSATGDITEPGTLIATSLSGSGSTVSLLGASATANQIVAIAPTFTATSFTLRDGLALSLNGLSATTLGVTATTLDVTGAVSGTDVSLASSTGTLGVDAGGSVTGSNTLTLASASSIHDDGALIVPGTLTGSATGTASLLGSSASANAIGRLGEFTANGFALASGSATGLSVIGTVAGAGSASISERGPLTIASGGLVTATAVSLTTIGGDLTIAGGASAGTLTLDAGGALNETGALNATVLTGTATGNASLTGSNAIDTLASFTAPGFTLLDNNPLSITGALAGGSLASVTDASTIDVAGTGQVVATSSGLTGTGISIEGAVAGSATAIDATSLSISIPGSVTGSATLALAAPLGAITATGTLTSALLTGTTGGTASLTGSADSVTELGSFTANGLTLVDDAPLAISGPVQGGDFASVSDTGGVTLDSGASLTASTVTLAAGGIELDGTLLGSLATTLVSTSTINAPGAIETAFLTGSASGTADLTGANAIGTLGGFTASAITLDDGTLASPITVTGLSIIAPVSAPGAVAITEAGPLTIASAGSVSGSTVALTASGNSLSIAGAATATTSLSLSAGTSMTETGTLTAATLTLSTPGSASLLGASATANQIGTLAASNAGGLSLADGADLTITGLVTGGTLASIADTGSLMVAAAGNLSATSVSLSAGAAGLSIDGLVTGTASTSLASLGTIGETGRLQTGSLTASAIGDVSLTQTANVIGTLGGVTAPDFLLDATTGSLAPNGMTVSGAVVIAGNAAIVETGTLAIPGTISANTLSLSSTGANLTLAGMVTGTTSVALSAHTNIDETVNGQAGGGQTGTLTAATLTGGAGGSASLLGAANAIGNLGSFAAPGGLSLSDSDPLIVTGPASGSLVALTAPSLTVPGSITGGAVALTATGTNIGIAGSVTGAATTTLTAAGAITETGTLTTGLLTGSATGAASLQGASATANAIGTLGAFSALSLALEDGSALTIGGPVAITDSASVTAASSLLLTGSLAATTVTLASTNAGISLAGSLAGATGVSLSALAGTIGETGTITTPLLDAGALGAIQLAGATPAANRIGTLGAVTGASLVLDDGIGVNIAGPVGVAGAATILDGSTIDLSGTLAAGSVGLTGSAITIPGSLSGSNLVSLSATGTIGETGSLDAGTLALTAGGSASLLGNNQIGTLGDISAVGLALADAGSGTITGTLATGPSLALTYGGSLTLAASGSLSATALDLAASSLTLDGHATATTVTLDATFGGIEIGGLVSGTDSVGMIAATTITEGGTLVAGSLTATASGAANFVGVVSDSNRIANLGSLSAGALTLDDGIALAVAGPVTVANGASLTDGVSITVPGLLTATNAVLVAPALNVSGNLSAQSGTLLATAGDLTIAGSVAGTTNLLLQASGAIEEPGTLTTGNLTGSAGTTASLIGATNTIGTLAFTARDLAVTDATALDVDTAVGTDTVAITTGGNLTFLGDLQGNAVTLVSGGNITSEPSVTVGTLGGSAAGSVAFGGGNSVSLRNQIGTLGNFTANGLSIVNAGDLQIAGTVLSGDANGIASAVSISSDHINITGTLAGGTVELVAHDTISDTGVLIATNLTGSAAGSALFPGASSTANTVASLGNFMASSLGLATAGSLTVSGAVVTSQTISLAAAGNVAIPGSLQTSTLTLISGGNIDEPGTIVANLLTGSSAGSASLLNGGAFTNAIGQLGRFVAGTGFALDDQSALTVAGAVNAGTTMSMTSDGSIALTAPLSAPVIALAAGGPISEDGAGVIDTGTLTATSGGGIALGAAANQIGNVGSLLASGGDLNLVDASPLTAGLISATGNATLAVTGGSISLLGGASANTLDVTANGAATYTGPLVANTIVSTNAGPVTISGGVRSNFLTVTASGSATYSGPIVANTLVSSTGGQVTLSGDLTTGGLLRPTGTITAASLPTATSGVGGAYFEITGGGAFNQVGDTTVNPSGGGDVVAVTTDGGAISFENLFGTRTWLLLNAASGRIGGNVYVQGLDVDFNVGSQGAANLFGTVNNLTGLGAAGAGFITPQKNNVYRINNCPIQSVNCILLRPEAVPVVNPVSDLDAGVLQSADDDPDLILPDIGGQGIEVGAGEDRRDKDKPKDIDVQMPDIGRRDIPQQ